MLNKLCILFFSITVVFNQAGAEGIDFAEIIKNIKPTKEELLKENKRMQVVTKKANNGNMNAQYELGLYENSRGNGTVAAVWFLAAAQQGLAEAQFKIGQKEYIGRDIPQNKDNAITWFQMAGNQGHAEAQIMSGFMYQNGEAGAKDDITAANWYAKSIGSGDLRGRFLLATMYANGSGVEKNLIIAYGLANGTTFDPSFVSKLEDILTVEEKKLGQCLTRLISRNLSLDDAVIILDSPSLNGKC
ncbi:tetratricopeptide repeat protein [Deefgea salmonis]|uniref:Sel1 repeat family protein n=1 Tax=Deefgea salmonis TaxID=2875502 RepID=A0ABS8BJG2_9NEIS|nr:tetratricopeptide repeat protein [Deefgea salmonis]MCB5195666.1 sel1 repeat family protein [Deefgea salmonis]